MHKCILNVRELDSKTMENHSRETMPFPKRKRIDKIAKGFHSTSPQVSLIRALSS